jgi:ADP-ribose pyrophosphatase
MPTNESRLVLTTERFRVEELTRTYDDGRQKRRSVVRHPGAVAIIPMVDDDHVCLIRNYRASVDRVLVEIVAGTLDSGESPLATAHRELREETGYTAASMEPLATFLLSPGILDEQMHVFVAGGLQAGPPERELGEEIENLVTPWPDAIAMALDGRITDAKTIAALLLYDRRR